MQLLSFRFKFEDENLVVRKDFVTINKTRNVMIIRIRILIIVSQKLYISNNDIIIVT